MRSVKVAIGTQAGVVADSLQFCFAALVRESSMAGAVLAIEPVPFAVHCRACGTSSYPDDGIVVCPACGSVETDVTGGMDLRVLEVELEDNNGGAP